MSLTQESNGVLLKKIGEGVRACRLRKNFSQSQLAELCGVSIPTITRLETGRGNISLHHLLSVLKVLDMVDEMIKPFRGMEASPTLLAKAIKSKTQKRVRKKKDISIGSDEKWVWGENKE
jgi:transcriptional regulator with XRE-family HTH domain